MIETEYCRACGGTGYADESKGLVGDCWMCAGTGTEVEA